MVKPVMFLRTAQTEQRIDELEKQVTMILTHLKLNEPTKSDEEWEAAKPKGYDGEPGAGEDAPLPPPKHQPQKAKRRA